MKVNIEITEGCTDFSYLINNVEWMDYVSKNSKHYNAEFLQDVCEKLIHEAQKQYQLPLWVTDYFWDGDYDTFCSQDTFITLVKNNKNTKIKSLGNCDECGDIIYRWTLELEINQ